MSASLIPAVCSHFTTLCIIDSREEVGIPCGGDGDRCGEHNGFVCDSGWLTAHGVGRYDGKPRRTVPKGRSSDPEYFLCVVDS